MALQHLNLRFVLDRRAPIEPLHRYQSVTVHVPHRHVGPAALQACDRALQRALTARLAERAAGEGSPSQRVLSVSEGGFMGYANAGAAVPRIVAAGAVAAQGVRGIARAESCARAPGP